MPAIVFDPSWQPSEDSATLLDERTWLIGAILTGVGYGIVLVLTVMCISNLIGSLKRPNLNMKLQLASLTYVICTFVFATLFVAGSSKMAQLSFIDYRNYPGGPAAFEEVMFSIPISEMGNVAFVLSNWFADVVVVWRCIVVYKGCRAPWWSVYTVPCLAYTASWILGLLWLVQVSAPASSPWASSTINFTQPYFWTSFSLNVTMTFAIVARLMVYRYRISKVMGKTYGRQYTSIASLVIESSLLYTSFQLLFIVPFAMNTAVQTLFLQPLSQIQIVAPLLVIYRVSSGRAWTSNTSTQIFKSQDRQQVIGSNKLHEMVFAEHQAIGTETTLGQ
ncbi:uncharacterized protein C8R40DRAFT_1060086 [Lentinula edodes]|uniref:uncharacterized protein n=1 Tax=Lentinula edodes TaxID=5353 RepID=UPI001E8CAA4A|nr:uncharacterized protein C8R40DRAFT_1060034 [Lentinula edodes]XP_046080284.1 uncharacterized protein C8R40DRAFT_1060086 [Lentinula edodes]KAH7869185.1 hypothetical protein C8R40DRAFT_1060034 [Lentinula edodes]KAH7869190.1 hypothetical protein C8R40DRAFT_1060086 [Lentinula edodes]